MGIGIVLQMVWMFLTVLTVLFYMVTGYLVWKTAYMVMLSFIPVFLFFLPKGFIPVAASSVEERVYGAIISLVILLFIFWDHIGILLETEQRECLMKNMPGMLLLIPKSAGLLYSFYGLLKGNIIVCFLLWVIIMSVFSKQSAVSTILALKQRKKSSYFIGHNENGRFGKIGLPIVLSDIAIVCCFIINSESSLLCALLLLYSELCFFVYHMCSFPEAKGQVLCEIQLSILVLFLFGIMTACNFFVKTNGGMMWMIKLVFNIVVPGMLLGFGIKRIRKR